MANGRRGYRRRGGRDLLSRNEREQVLMTEAGFAPPQDWGRCPSCLSFELEADVKLGAGPMPEDFPATNSSCSECGGIGFVQLYGKSRLDPYMTPQAVAMAG